MAIFNHPSLSEPLTTRELEVLKLITEGYSNGEIAQALFITLGTVKWYNRRLFEKLNVTKRTEAAARVHELGLLQNDEAHIVNMPVTAHHNLPNATTPFIGRETEIAELAHLIMDKTTRLITILAPGGMGKTRLAVETARLFVTGQKAYLFPHGVFFISFAPIRTAEQMVSAFAEQIGIQFYGAEPPRQQLLDYFREKRMLLLLDNFEHLLDGTDFIRELLQTAPYVQLVVTSREKLNLHDEAVFVLRGLEFSEWETDADVLASSAVRLFVQHSKLARTDFTLQHDDLRHLGQICQLVQTMPLGLILAAAWVEMLSIKEIAEEIAANLDFLKSQSRDIPDRQRSIRAVFNHVWKRLLQEEQSTFMKLAVFRGGFTRRAAQSITGASLHALQTLVSKALIVRGAHKRFEIHELLRQYAEMELEQSGEADATRDAHSVYYLKFMAEREADIKGRRQVEAVAEIQADFENVRVAWYRAQETANLGLLDDALEGITWFCLLISNFQENSRLFQTAIDYVTPSDRANPPPLWGKLVLRLLRLERWRMGSYVYQPDAEALIHKCLSIAQRAEDELEIANCLYSLGDYAEGTAFDDPTAIDYYDRCIPIYESKGDLFHLAWVIHMRSYCFWIEQPEERIRLQLQSLEIQQQIGNAIGASSALVNLCEIAYIQGNIKDAEHYLRQSILASQSIFNVISLWHDVNAATIPLLRGDFVRAYYLASETLRISEKANYIITIHFSRAIVGLALILREDYATGLPICEQCLPMRSKPHIPTFAYLGLVIAACSHGDMHAVYTHLASMLKASYIFMRVAYLFIAPIAVSVFYHDNQLEHATELVGAASHLYPEVTWHEQWALFSHLRADLRAQLGDDSYESALKRGEQLKIEQIVSELQTFVAE